MLNIAYNFYCVFLFYVVDLFSRGVEEYIPKALSHLEMCLGTKPLADSMFRVTTPGLSNGMILITGSKGSGKSSLAKALCRKMAEKENLARIFHVDCKPLRGKQKIVYTFFPRELRRCLDLHIYAIPYRKRLVSSTMLQRLYACMHKCVY